MYPEDLKYTREHEWVRLDGSTAMIGITAYAQEALGDIVFVSLPEVGAALASGESFGEIESTKSVSEVYTPGAGRVTARNDQLESEPELVNSDPYGDGWLVIVELADASGLEELLTAGEYVEYTKQG
ncbi:glycine cleavage system protein H [Frankia canadensis]|uniref:Glycine cleavage system H protein n=1 Tax=Frankia canadensis TaxID=1836972 RepID=A0A2I2KIS7_9ACTN|nr:glycine cleavage system protein GcvH [Frankia canadensis]SNQ45557.1 glycine cleavage system protein H [Frankia canadensis]SOU52847.1 glycine cleavage system protein H [Frankia canadensis]